MFDDIKEHLTGGLVTKAKNLLEAIRMECYDRGELEKYQDRIFLANGTLFLDGSFVEEKGFCLNRLPIRYNPNVPQPEIWLRFLSELLEPEDILTLQEFMGYCLIPCTRGQVMLLIKGNGGEGKSRIGVVMHNLFGPNAKNGSIDKVETSAFARADLQHVLVMVDDDTKMEALSSTHYMKSIITAETPMDLERKKEQGFQGDMYVRFMAFSNGDLEALYDKSEGFFRRQLILQTRRKPPGREDDPFLSDKLKQEAEGIFLWCLDGLKRLQANNYRFTVSQRAAENKEHAKRNANNLVEFMQSEGYIQLKADSTITSRDLYAIYQTWCEDNGYRPIAQRSVGSYLKSHLEDYNLEASNKITKPQYAILRFAKYKGPEIGRIEAHDERTKEKYASNPDVDTGRSRLNFHLVKPRRSYRAEAEKQISEAGCRARKDSVRVVETLITASPEFFANKKPREVSD